MKKLKIKNKLKEIRSRFTKLFVKDNFIECFFKNGQFNIKTLSQYETRGDSVIKILKLIKNKYPIAFPDNEDIFVTFGDRPTHKWIYALYKHSFCTTEFYNKQTRAFSPFPCPYFDGWPEIGMNNSDELIKYFNKNNDAPESNKIFWIGANMHESRSLLKKLSEENPEIFDVCIMEWKRGGPKLVSKTRYVSLPDHAKYKYLIDCPGIGYSARLKWLIATGRPTFVVEREVIEPWFKSMKPFEHYIPVKADLSDLVDKFKQIENNPALYKKISINAKILATENLLLDKQIDILFRND
jgi:hypothetical protein